MNKQELVNKIKNLLEESKEWDKICEQDKYTDFAMLYSFYEYQSNLLVKVLDILEKGEN